MADHGYVHNLESIEIKTSLDNDGTLTVHLYATHMTDGDNAEGRYTRIRVVSDMTLFANTPMVPLTINGTGLNLTMPANPEVTNDKA